LLAPENFKILEESMILKLDIQLDDGFSALELAAFV
jgi:hypothetical protein